MEIIVNLVFSHAEPLLQKKLVAIVIVIKPFYEIVHLLLLLIRIKSGELGFLGFFVPGKLDGVICKPEGVA